MNDRDLVYFKHSLRPAAVREDSGHIMTMLHHHRLERCGNQVFLGQVRNRDKKLVGLP